MCYLALSEKGFLNIKTCSTVKYLGTGVCGFPMKNKRILCIEMFLLHLVVNLELKLYYFS